MGLEAEGCTGSPDLPQYPPNLYKPQPQDPCRQPLNPSLGPNQVLAVNPTQPQPQNPKLTANLQNLPRKEHCPVEVPCLVWAKGEINNTGGNWRILTLEDLWERENLVMYIWQERRPANTL